jgi:hypothetical protein
VLEVCGFVDETVLIAELGFDDAKFFEKVGVGGAGVGDAASGLRGGISEGGQVVRL